MGWYNHAHRHSGIAMLSPADVHYGRAPQIIAARGVVLDNAYAKHPERFVRQPPRPLELSDVSWINQPTDDERTEATAH